VLAYKWWLLAAAQGRENVRTLITDMEGQMTRDQIAEGQKLAREFKPM